MLQNEQCLHFGPWGVTEIFLGKTIKFLLKNLRILENMHHFIFTRILTSSESSYDKCYSLSFLMSKTWIVYFIGYNGTKTADF
jgi:hypothetical protein